MIFCICNAKLVNRMRHLNVILSLLAFSCYIDHSHAAFSLGDFDGNGKADLIFRDADGSFKCNVAASGEISNPFESVTGLPTSMEWHVAAQADLDGDGKTDFLLRHPNGSWEFVPMNGCSPRTDDRVAMPNLVEREWRIVATHDFGNDGRDDLVLRNDRGAWLILAMDGLSVESRSLEPSGLEANKDWQVIGLGYFDDDRSIDILTRHVSGEWRMHSASSESAMAFNTVNVPFESRSDWRAEGVGDLDGDGSDEILLRHATGTWKTQALVNSDTISTRQMDHISSDWDWRLKAVGNVHGISDDELLLHQSSTDRWFVATPLAPVESDVLNAIETERDAGWRIPTPPLFIPDRALRALIKNKLNLDEGTWITRRAMASITSISIIGFSHMPIEDLRGLEEASNLNVLALTLQDIRHLTPLIGLNLKNLSLTFNRISDLSPIAGLDKLTHLNLLDNEIEDLSPIQNLTNLTNLTLAFNEITDISPLRDLVNIINLDLNTNMIEDISALSNLRKLQQLFLSSNRVKDISALGYLSALNHLGIGVNLIEDIEPLLELNRLYTVHISVNPLSELSITNVIPRLKETLSELVYSKSGVFRDDQGTTVNWAYDVDLAHSGMNGVLVYFHGNNAGSARSRNGADYGRIQSLAREQNLVALVIASPEGSHSEIPWHTPFFSGDGTRFWNYDRDLDVVHDLLQSGIGGLLNIDFNQVFLMGSSQGTCFLNRFLTRWGHHYGGGVLADCGCSEGLEPLWMPNKETVGQFRVFVRAATNDYLHRLSEQAYGYYKYVIGIDTRADLKREGGHCAGGDISDADALDWLVDDVGLPDDDVEEPHFKRVNVFDRLVGMVADAEGRLWIVQQESDGTSPSASLWRSVDRGESFELVLRMPHKVFDLDASNNTLIITTSDGTLYRSNQSLTAFDLLPTTSLPISPTAVKSSFQGVVGWPHIRQSPTLTTTPTGDLLLIQLDDKAQITTHISSDIGDSWKESPGPQGKYDSVFVQPDPINSEDEHWFLTVEPDVAWYSKDSSLSWQKLQVPDPVGSLAWDGRKMILFDRDVFGSARFSDDMGATWELAETSYPISVSFGLYGSARLAALGNGDVLLLGGGRDGHLYNGHRNEWRQIYGGAGIGFRPDSSLSRVHKVAVDRVRGDIFVSDGRGIFRIDAEYRVSADEFAAYSDLDNDSVPDAIDEFPSDPDEYLDTDMDGIGNNEDKDDDGDGIDDVTDASPLDRQEHADFDGDGIGDRSDRDRDGDLVPDEIDWFPSDALAARDIDGDGIGDRQDDDKDGDSVLNADDAFPLYPHESSDSDGDWIGDRLDPDPNDSTLTSSKHLTPAARHSNSKRERVIELDQTPIERITYPTVRAGIPLYGRFILGDLTSPTNIEVLLITNPGITTQLLYLDRNADGDLTNDGPPFRLENGVPIELWSTIWVEVSYKSDITLPYWFWIRVASTHNHESHRGQLKLLAQGKASQVALEDGQTLYFMAYDIDVNGIFNEEEDFYCLDHSSDGHLDGCFFVDGPDHFSYGDIVSVENEKYTFSVDPSGYTVSARLVKSTESEASQVKRKQHSSVQEYSLSSDLHDLTSEDFLNASKYHRHPERSSSKSNNRMN